MSYIYKKKVRGIYSLYMGENARINGMPKRVKSKYLGPLKKFEEYFASRNDPIESIEHFEYGLSTALRELIKQLMIDRIIRNNTHTRTDDAYVDKRIILMVMNRLCDPCAKYSLQKWFSKTNLVNTFEIPLEELEAFKIYRAMDVLEKHVDEIENEVCKTIAIHEKLSLSPIYLDFTNQESYSKNTDSELLKHGHNKRGHDDLRQVNLSLSCDASSGIPFFHKSYPGNNNDKQFIKVYAPELRSKFDLLGHPERATLVIDRGINGIKDFELLRENKFDYVGGLIESEFPQYFNIPKSKLRNTYVHERETKDDVIIKFDYTKQVIYGEEHLIITLYNEENYEDRVQTLNERIHSYKEQCEMKLQELKKEIMEKTFQSHWNNVEKIKNALKEIDKEMFSIMRIAVKSYRFELTWSIVENKKEYVRKLDGLGKYVLFTNRRDLTPDDVIKLYYAKNKIEKNFHYLKSNGYTNRYVRMGPMLHSKDERIKSHNYTCVLALQLYQIINYRLKEKKLKLSVQEALDELKRITCYYVKNSGQDAFTMYINPLTQKQNDILHALEIKI